MAERAPTFKKKETSKAETPERIKEERICGDLKEDERQITAYKFYTDLISSGGIKDTNTLESFFTPSFYKGILEVKGGGRDLLVNNRKFNERQVADAVVSPEQQQLLRELVQETGKVVGEKDAIDKSIQGLRFYTDLISSGGIKDTNTLESFFTPSFYKGILEVKGGGRDLLVNNRKFNERQVADAVVSPEQQQLLRELVQETGKVVGEKDAIDKSIQGLRFYTDLISSGGIKDTNTLESFFTPSFYKGILEVKGGGRDLLVNNRKFNERQVADAVVSPEQQQLLRELVQFVADKQAPEELQENLKRLVSAKDEGAAERLKNVMVMNGAVPIKDAISVWAGKFEKNVRQQQFQKAFYEKIEAKAPPAEIAKFLTDFEGKDTDDVALVARLLGISNELGRQELVKTVVGQLNQPKRGYDSIVELLTQYATSTNEIGRRTAQTLIETAYEAELSEYKARVWRMLKPGVDTEMLRIAIDGLPLRPSVGSYDYVATVKGIRDKIVKQLSETERLNRLNGANKIRSSFPKEEPEKVLDTINNLGVETIEDEQVKVELLELYRSYLAVAQPGKFDERFAKEIEKRRADNLQAQFATPELGSNRQALEYMRQNYYSVISPLIESFRADATTKDTIQSFVKDRAQYRQRLASLEEQRRLTDAERAYLKSVELLTIFNPYLVAAVYAEPGVTTQYLKHHFEMLSKETIAELTNGQYVPLLQIGLGPNGLAALGETVRNNPELAGQMLVVDAGQQPGGPFAIPEGAAWELNSANRRGVGGPVLPDPRENDSTPELARVRAYGSPLRWLPGERTPGADVRAGSINATVDYLPTPDDLSTARYPTNEELAIILSLQTAMLANRVALQTKVVSVVPNPDKDAQGDKLVTLSVTDKDGETKLIKITTDAIFNSTGLGEPSYGFKLEGSGAERVMEQTADAPFPKISTTLEAFSALSSRTGNPVSPGKSLIIYGSGNSADTLIEFIGNIFQGNNPRVRDVTKIYVVATGDLSARPRYAALADVKARNGRGNLLEFVKDKVTDVEFASSTGDPKDRQLRVLGTGGRPLTTLDGKPIVGDAVIAAVGFKPESDNVFSAYLDGGQSYRDKSTTGPTEPLALPTNKDVTVAETLKKDSNIVFLGTSSNPDFQNVDKLAQLPREAREALIRNGAENAVAIGFRAPDTQAAVNIFLNSREVELNKSPKKEKKQVPLDGPILKGTNQRIPLIADPADLRIPDNMTNEPLLLSPLISYALKNNGRIYDQEKGFTGELKYELSYEQGEAMLSLTFTGGERAPESLSQELNAEIMQVCADNDFQRYAVSALRKKRRNPKLELFIRYKNGLIDQQNTFVQA